MQQYLLEMAGGRYQALGLAWDSRPGAHGGQRTGTTRAAECHSTNLQKNYRAETKTYATTWSEINVSCEACHGPASGHVTWAARDTAARATDSSKGLVFSMRDTSGGTWTVPAGELIAKRTAPLSSRAEVETCARCHARRGQSWLDYQFGQTLASTHRVALLDEGLCEADGQQRDEVLRARLVPAEQDVRGWRDLQRLPRPAHRCPKGVGQHPLHAVPRPGRLRHSSHTHHRAGTPAAVCRACQCARATTWWWTRGGTMRSRCRVRKRASGSAPNAERREAQVTLGGFEARLGRAGAAEAAYRTAMALQPQSAPSYVNLADLLRATGRDAEGEQVLRDALGVVPPTGRPALQHALGLQLVRAKRYADAMVWLRLAAEGDADDARYAFAGDNAAARRWAAALEAARR